MDNKHEARRRRVGGGAGAALIGILCLLASQTLCAQPAYRRVPPGSEAGYYPEPPRGFRGGRPYECDLYARDNADWYGPRGAGIGAGAVRGAVGGAVFGGIVGGSEGARRGALAGGGLGAVASGARARQDREVAYRLAYDDCMQRFQR
jgi:hypothetical protein